MFAYSMCMYLHTAGILPIVNKAGETHILSTLSVLIIISLNTHFQYLIDERIRDQLFDSISKTFLYK